MVSKFQRLKKILTASPIRMQLAKIEKTPLVLNHEMHYALQRLEHSDEHLFISGRAGTGKSTLLRLFRNTTHKRIAVVAPTGVAALNVKGQTIHSFFKFPPKLLLPHDLHRLKNRKIYQKLEILIIDEISMVRADMFDNMDQFLRLNRDIDEPFGGVKLIVFGDLFQLPPVVASQVERQYLKQNFGSPYFFSSKVYQALETNVECIELHTVYRQNQRHFINLLDNVRRNSCDFDDLEDLNLRVCNQEEVDPGTITLTTRNDIVRRINHSKLLEIDQPIWRYPATVKGRFDPRLYPTDINLEIKVGAQVMLLKNDVQRRYVNGSIGQVLYADNETIRVQIQDNDKEEIIALEPALWEMTKYKWSEETGKIDSDVIGSFLQYPIKLAWAITIHKSQGKTFSSIFLDMGRGAFETGQTYVALSRCSTYEGLNLKSPLKPSDIMADDRIVDYYNRWK